MSENKSLVALAETSAQIERMLAEAGGELTPELETMLSMIDVKLPEKVENYSLLMERMDALAQFYDSRMELLSRMASAARKVVDRCEENLKVAMVKLETDEIQGIDIRFKLQNTAGKVVIPNEKELDPAYTTIESVTKIDKKRIGDDLKLGIPVRGARLEVGKSLRKYANTPGRK